VTYPLFGIDAKFWGVVAMGAVDPDHRLAALAGSQPGEVDPLSRLYKGFLTAFIISFFILGYLGMLGPTPMRTIVAQICSVIYFAFFLLMPIYSSLDKCQPEPDRVTSK
jgi:ubiquinol-cytochrome c reductase cytochrome b subunit